MRFPLVVAASLCALAPTPLFASADHAPQNDAGTGADAGDSFDEATALPRHTIEGVLAPEDGDADDWYRFHAELGEPIHVFAYYNCFVLAAPPGPIELVAPTGQVMLAAPAPCPSTSTVGLLTRPNLVLAAAPMSGEYRLHFTGDFGGGSYTACRTPCAWPEGVRPIGLGDTYHRATWRTLVVPPAHGDLGNPDGPTREEYLAATLDAIAQWERTFAAFAADHPEYAYLTRLVIDVEVYDGTQTLDARVWDVNVRFEETHPYARGLGGCGDRPSIHHVNGWTTPPPHVPPRAPMANCTVMLTLVNTAGMAGETVPDFISLRALRNGVFHEFGHVFGIIHTTTLVDGVPDLMTSPAPFFWGDGATAGNGGVEPPLLCVSSLDLQAIAYLYRWVPTGRVQHNTQPWFETTLPYELYC